MWCSVSSECMCRFGTESLQDDRCGNGMSILQRLSQWLLSLQVIASLCSDQCTILPSSNVACSASITALSELMLFQLRGHPICPRVFFVILYTIQWSSDTFESTLTHMEHSTCSDQERMALFKAFTFTFTFAFQIRSVYLHRPHHCDRELQMLNL